MELTLRSFALRTRTSKPSQTRDLLSKSRTMIQELAAAPPLILMTSQPPILLPLSLKEKEKLHLMRSIQLQLMKMKNRVPPPPSPRATTLLWRRELYSVQQGIFQSSLPVNKREKTWGSTPKSHKPHQTYSGNAMQVQDMATLKTRKFGNIT